MADSGTIKLLFFVWVSITLLRFQAFSEPTLDKQALLDFISRIHHSNRLDWALSISACNWTGVVCDLTHSNVVELRLPGVGLLGPVPANTIGRLSKLRVLSLRSNRVSGALPDDFGNLTFLKSLYLQNNRISGSLPEWLGKLNGLNRLDVSFNRFQGEIPAGISTLLLETLYLQNNNFSGKIPAGLNASALVGFSVANNNLTGQIPESLSKFPESSFAGNVLCGSPLSPCGGVSPSPSPAPTAPSPGNGKSHKSGKLSKSAIVGIVVAAAVVLLILLILLLCFCWRRGTPDPSSSASQPPSSVTRFSAAEAGATSSSKDDIITDESKHKLVFFEGSKSRFELEDLLRASAEVLGKGTTGTTYKAELDDNTAVSVKRMRDVTAAKKEFEMQMNLIGQVRHENVVKLIAYYFAKDEKLLIADFVPGGSLSSLLHGSRGSGRPPLDWVTRYKIGLTAAKGLHHLHQATKQPHGNLKASNVLITASLDACISDFGIYSITGPSVAPNRATEYRAPEGHHTRKPTFKSDVYSFGVMLLELLTGKGPSQVAAIGEDGIDLPRWVQTVMAKEWTAEVFDAEVVMGGGTEEAMVGVLQVAMRCVDGVAERRPEMGEVVRMLEMVQEPLDFVGKK